MNEYAYGEEKFKGLIKEDNVSAEKKLRDANLKLLIPRSSLEEHLIKSVSKLKNFHQNHPGFSVMGPRWDKLLRNDVLSFTIDAIYQELEKSIKEDKHKYRVQKCYDIFVIVSTVPTIDLSKAPTYFLGGYFAFTDMLLGMLNPDEYEMDLVNWILLYDEKQYMATLAFFPAQKITPPNNILIFPNEVLNEEEKKVISGNVKKVDYI